MDNTAVHSTDYASSVADGPILAKQTSVPPVPTIHQTRPTAPDEWVTVTQQTIYLEIMGMSPGSNHHKFQVKYSEMFTSPTLVSAPSICWS